MYFRVLQLEKSFSTNAPLCRRCWEGPPSPESSPTPRCSKSAPIVASSRGPSPPTSTAGRKRAKYNPLQSPHNHRTLLRLQTPSELSKIPPLMSTIRSHYHPQAPSDSKLSKIPLMLGSHNRLQAPSEVSKIPLMSTIRSHSHPPALCDHRVGRVLNLRLYLRILLAVAVKLLENPCHQSLTINRNHFLIVLASVLKIFLLHRKMRLVLVNLFINIPRVSLM